MFAFLVFLNTYKDSIFSFVMLKKLKFKELRENSVQTLFWLKITNDLFTL